MLRDSLTIKRTFAALIVVFAFAGIARAADAGGKWTSEFDSGVGHQKYTFTFKVENGKLTGTAHRDVEGQVTDTEISEGKIDGDKVTFVENLKVNDQELKVEYKGTIAGDEMKLNRAVGEIANADIVVKRSKESTTQPTTKP